MLCQPSGLSLSLSYRFGRDLFWRMANIRSMPMDRHDDGAALVKTFKLRYEANTRTSLKQITVLNQSHMGSSLQPNILSQYLCGSRHCKLCQMTGLCNGQETNLGIRSTEGDKFRTKPNVTGYQKEMQPTGLGCSHGRRRYPGLPRLLFLLAVC